MVLFFTADDMGVFINREFSRMQTMLAYTRERSEGEENDYDYHYFLNVSNALFLKAEAEGLRTADARDFFLMACWLAMAAAEVERQRPTTVSMWEMPY